MLQDPPSLLFSCYHSSFQAVNQPRCETEHSSHLELRLRTNSAAPVWFKVCTVTNPDSYLYKCPLQPAVQQNSTHSLSHNIKCVYFSITHFISTAFMCSVTRLKKCTHTDTHKCILSRTEAILSTTEVTTASSH
jgi:hypothetical protein